MTLPLPECRCPRCGWEGLWEDVEMQTIYRETRIDSGVTLWACPLCGEELDSLELKENDDGKA